MFSFLVKKDPVCGMKEKKGNGFYKDNNWFCSKVCIKKYESSNKAHKKGCCH